MRRVGVEQVKQEKIRMVLGEDEARGARPHFVARDDVGFRAGIDFRLRRDTRAATISRGNTAAEIGLLGETSM